MESIKKLIALLIIPLSLVNCSSDPSGYDVSAPINIGNPVKELTIPNKEGELVKITHNLSNDDCLTLFGGLKSFGYMSEGNYDAQLIFKSNVGDEKLPNAYYKERQTSVGDKRGCFRQFQSGDYKQQQACITWNTMQYTSAYQLETYGNKTLGFYGNIRSKEFIDNYNNRYIENGLEPILYFDPDYPAGAYTKEGVEINYMGQESADYIVTKRDETGKDLETRLTTQGKCVYSYRIINVVFSDGSLINVPRLLEPISIKLEAETIATLVPAVSYQMTDKYLIVNIEKPYGLIIDRPMKHENYIDYQTGIEQKCYAKVSVYYNVQTGVALYLKADFKTKPTYVYPEIFKGSFTLKRLPDSDEGYTEYLRLRDYIVKQSNQFTPDNYTPQPTSSEPLE